MPGPSVMSHEARRAGRRFARARMALYLSLRAVARAIQTMSRAGRSLWARERRAALGVLSPPRKRAAEDAARAELERVAAERGLPISLLPLAVVDGDGNPLTGPALLQSAQRYGGDQVLVGRGDGAAPPSGLQWTLYPRSAHRR